MPWGSPTRRRHKNLQSRRGPFSDQTVWDQLKTVYDPEIPGNIRTRITKPVELRFALA